jgi:DNA-binding PadR family transcriptional regulator
MLRVQEGALYPALHRLEKRGYLEELWGVSETGREAKFYRLSPSGRKRLREETLRWRRYARMMQLALAAPRP